MTISNAKNGQCFKSTLKSDNTVKYKLVILLDMECALECIYVEKRKVSNPVLVCFTGTASVHPSLHHELH